MKILRRSFYLVVLFIFVLSVYLADLSTDYKKDLSEVGFRNLMTSADIVPNTFFPYAVLKQHTITFDEQKSTMRKFANTTERPYFIIIRDNSYYSAYPVFSSLFALPVYFIPIALNKIPTFVYYENVLKVLVLGRITASLYTALTVGLFYISLRLFYPKAQEYKRLTMIIFLAFGTTLWSIASRGMWQHTFAAFLSSVLLLLLYYKDKRSWFYTALGFICGLMVLVRPTSIFLAIIIALWVFVSSTRAEKTRFCLGVLPTIILLGIHNSLLYGSVFSEGYGSRNDFRFTTPFYVGFLGQLFSPSRSFFTVSPPLVLFYVTSFGFFRDKLSKNKKVKNIKHFLRNLNTKDLIVLISSLYYFSLLVLYSSWFDWSGANGFGYRFFTDMLPLLGFCVFYTYEKIKKPWVVLFFFMALVSVLIQFNAVFNLKSRCSDEDDWNFQCVNLLKMF